MFALVLAMVTLTSVDPDPIVTPTPVIHDRLPGATGFGGNSAAGLTTGAGSTFSVCTFGGTGFGSDLWANANGFTRALALPACADSFDAFGAAGFAPLGTMPLGLASLGFAPPATVSPWLPAAARAVAVPKAFPVGGPARISTGAAPIFHEPPATFMDRARSVPATAPSRHR